MSRWVCHQLKALALAVLFGLGLSGICASNLVVFMMGRLTIEQILFHLMTPMKGVSPEISYYEHSFCMLMGIWTFEFWAYCSGFLGWCVENAFCCRLRRLRFWRPYVSVTAVLVVWGWACSLAFENHDLGNFLVNIVHPSRMIDDHYVKPSLEDFQAPERKRNLVLIISESLERTYCNPALFGDDLLKELTALEGEGICFKGQIEVNGADNTIASTTAMLYGLPRLMVGMEGWHNYIEGNMFSHSTSILHVLRKHGYSIWHVQGGNLEFASTYSLFEDFPDAHLVDETILCEDPEYRQLVETGAAYGWGVNDRIMLKAARRLMTQAAATGPFVMTVGTIDSHYDGYLEPGAPRPFHDYRDVVRNEGRLLADFVTWIRSQPFGKDTVIVVVGDHFVMREAVGPCQLASLPNGTNGLPVTGEIPDRTVYSCVFNSALSAPPVSSRLFASFDWAPTLLESLGFRWPSRRFGVGVSLFSGERTLLEEIGGEAYERESRRRSSTYGKILTGSFQ